MKKTLALTGMLLLSGAVFAQVPPGGTGGPPDPEAHFQRIASELGLSDAQKPRVRQAMDEEHAALMAAMKQERDENTDIQAAHQNHEKIEQDMVEKLKPVLSAGQLAKLQEILAAEAAARHHHAAPGAAPAAPAN